MNNLLLTVPALAAIVIFAAYKTGNIVLDLETYVIALLVLVAIMAILLADFWFSETNHFTYMISRAQKFADNAQWYDFKHKVRELKVTMPTTGGGSYCAYVTVAK
jgi:hypothetical protein